MRAATEVIAVLALACGVAHAQSSQSTVAATAQFDRGRQLMDAGKFEDACKAFEASQQLEARLGTQYNLAGCYVKTGKLASAWAAYRELAQRDTNATRKKDSADKARALTPRLPKLVIQAPNHPADLVVSLNGLDVTSLLGVDNPIDLGSHQIVARAAGYAEKTQTAEIKAEGKTVTITIELEKATTAAPNEPVVTAGPTKEPAAPPRNEEGAPKSHRKLVALIVGGAGVALVGTGLYFGNVASGHYDDAEALCPSHQCTGAMLAGANDAYDKAKSSATVSTVLVIGGGVAIAAGVVLLVTGKSDHASATAWRVTPGVGNEPVGVSLGGGF